MCVPNRPIRLTNSQARYGFLNVAAAGRDFDKARHLEMLVTRMPHENAAKTKSAGI
jgi:hypothetical protein